MGVLMIDVNGNVKGSSVKMNEDILFCEKLTDLAKHNRSEFLHDFKQAFLKYMGKQIPKSFFCITCTGKYNW